MSIAPQADDEVEVVWEAIPGSQTWAVSCPCNEVLYDGSRGPGKALPLSTPVPIPGGWRRHGDIAPGDLVFGSNGQPCRVVGTFAPHQRETFRLTFNDGSFIDASDCHLWQSTIDRGAAKSWRIQTTLQIAERVKKGFPVWIPQRPCVEYPEKPLSIDSYMLGLWIGDGSASVRTRKPSGKRTRERKGYCVEFGTNDPESVAFAISQGFTVKRSVKGFTWLSGKERHKDALMELGLFYCKGHEKFIPSAILQNSAAVRLAFLQGLNDSDGTVVRAASRISTTSLRLADDLKILIRSLGGFVRVSVYHPHSEARQKLPSFNVDFSFPELVPFRLSRKVAALKVPERLGWFLPKIVKVESLGRQIVSCIKVDAPDSLYVAGEGFHVTHNTDAQLMRFRSLVGLGYGQHLRGIIFDREYKNLDDMIAKAEKHFFAFQDGAMFKRSKGDYFWKWPTGEVLFFRQIKRESDYMKFHGQEFPWIGWNELTKYPNRKIYDLMKSCNRSGFLPEKHTPRLTESQLPAHRKANPGRNWQAGDFATDDGKPLPEMPLQIFATTNPWGPGHSWVKAEFVDDCDPGQIVKTVTNVFNPRTKQRENVTRTRVRLFGTYKENIYLSPEYIAGLERETDPERRKAWLLGDWNIRAGGMFNDIYKESVHIIEDFKVPKGWRVDRAFDWGSSHPFSVGWYCVANGEAVTLNDGTRFAPRRGSVIRFAEWYGTSGAINDGLRLSGPEIAAGIMEREMNMMKRGVICGIPLAGPADGQIFQIREKDVATIGSKMAAEGVAWKPADKSAGSRINGWQLIRDALKNAVTGEGPGLFVTKSCKYARKFLPDTPRDEDNPDDVDTETEDHLQDELRYRLLDASAKWVAGIKTKHST